MEHKSDMGGVGSFSKASQSLYIGGLPTYSKEVEKSVRREFGEWGAIERVYYLKDKGCCFVKYRLRACAEFAKESMIGQTLQLKSALDSKEGMAKKNQKGKKRKYTAAERTGVLNIRWAHDDPNPRTIRKEIGDRRKLAETRIKEYQQRGQQTRAASSNANGPFPTTNANAWYPCPNTGGYPALQSGPYPPQSPWGAPNPGHPSAFSTNMSYVEQHPHIDSTGQYPDTTGQYPDTTGQYPDNTGQYPDTQSQYPDISNQSSESLGQYGQSICDPTIGDSNQAPDVADGASKIVLPDVAATSNDLGLAGYASSSDESGNA